MRLTQTYSQLRLVTADALALRAEQASREIPLARGQVHEFSADFVPLTAMLGLATRALRQEERIVFLGRACWPSFQILAAMLSQSDIEHQKSAIPLARCLFLDPPSNRERFWALAEALRCPGVGAVIADGQGLDATASRRLQLAAETRDREPGGLALLARSDARDAPSWAHTRWQVRPCPSRTARPPPPPDAMPALIPVSDGGMEEANACTGNSHSLPLPRQESPPSHTLSAPAGQAPRTLRTSAFTSFPDSLSTRMSWELTLLSCRHGGGRGSGEARGPRRWIFSWTYQVFRETGAFDLSPAVGHSTAQTPITQPA
jgi:hypothetical protein